MQRDFLYLLDMESERNKNIPKLNIIDKIVPFLNQLLHFFIIINILMLCLETVQELDEYNYIHDIFEIVSIVFFSIEYVVRVFWAIKKKRVLAYLLSPLGIIDLLSIIPYYLPLITGYNLSFFKILRLFRLLRIFKLYRYSNHLQAVMEVIKHKLEYLGALFFAAGIVVLFCSCATFYFEHDAQPDKFKNIFSALWWAVSTVMTIGYGDIIPITVGGKIMATMLGFIGISLLAVLAGIFSAGFVEVVDKKKVGGTTRKDNFRNKKED